MSPLVLSSPIRLELPPELDQRLLEQNLTYIDKSVEFELAKFKKNRWFRQKHGEEVYLERLEELKAARKKSLLFREQRDWTYSGLGRWLSDKFGVPLRNDIEYPESKLLPWAKPPQKQPRPYQQTMREELLAVRHGAVEVGTGLGKSFVIMLLAKELGLRTVVMTPSVSIAKQIHREFTQHLGQRYVGQYFDGKKEAKKHFVVAVDDSLAKVQEGSSDWNLLSQAQVFIADESHLCPAKSLARVCFGLLANAPYRFFFSGTQMRNDGLDLLLQAITGPIVFRMTVQEGVEQGYLAKPMFRVVRVRSGSHFDSYDANEMTRAHLYYNSEVNVKAAEIANLMVEAMDRPTVILVKELEQFVHLLPHLRHQVKFAHGGVTAENRDRLPKEYWDSDPDRFVDEFNRGDFPILVGTSCITTGTDIQVVKAIVYVQGGKSEIQVKQAVGRGTRRPEGKDDCFFIDFDISNVDVLHRHAEIRKEIYQEIYPDYEELSL